jgi:hypothetical protein
MGQMVTCLNDTYGNPMLAKNAWACDEEEDEYESVDQYRHPKEPLPLVFQCIFASF